MLGSADGAAVDATRFAVVDATPAESVAAAVGGAEAALVVALGGAGVDAMGTQVVVALGGAGVDAIGTWVVVVWPKAIPKRRKNIISGQIIVLPLMEASH